MLLLNLIKELTRTFTIRSSGWLGKGGREVIGEGVGGVDLHLVHVFSHLLFEFLPTHTAHCVALRCIALHCVALRCIAGAAGESNQPLKTAHARGRGRRWDRGIEGGKEGEGERGRQGGRHGGREGGRDEVNTCRGESITRVDDREGGG